MSDSISILIPTWNGRSLLEKFLAQNIEVFKAELKEWEVIIIDNGSQDGTAAFITQHFVNEPVRCIALDRNYGFGIALNKGIAQAKYQFIYLLNNDLRIVPGSLAPLLATFKDYSDVFSAYPWQTIFKGETQVTYAGGKAIFCRGLFRTGEQFGGDFRKQIGPESSWYASGAAALFDADKLRNLGGFNEIYSPAYYEDTDLSHRAWQRGWQVLSVPTPPVEHWHESTGSRIPVWKLRSIQQRNLFLFHWLVLRSPKFWLLHLLWLPANLVRETLRYSWPTLLGFLWALTYVFNVAKSRRGSDGNLD